MNRVKGLTPKQAYEFAKGIRKITSKGSKKSNLQITREFLENNQEVLLKNKSLSALVGASLALVKNGDSPKLPESLHNKILAYKAFADSPKNYKEKVKVRNAERYFQILDCYEKTKDVPKRTGWRGTIRDAYRCSFRTNLIINELSEEELEVLLNNPSYAFRYAKSQKKRLPKNIENKLLNDSPMEFSQRRYRRGKEWKEYMLETSKVLLDYCNKFGVGLPASVHNLILFRSANGEKYNNCAIHEGFNWHIKSWEERRKTWEDGFCCKYKRHIKNYNDFISYLPTLIAKKKLDCTNKISDLLKKRMSRKDRMYLETFVNVQMLNKDDEITTMFSAKAAA